MSLIGLLSLPDVRAKLKPLRPKLPRKIAAPLKVEPRSNRYGMVGTAFDYLLRFELHRRAPHAVAGVWVAECAPDRVWKNGYYLHLSRDDKGVVSVARGSDVRVGAEGSPEELEELAKEVAGRMRQVVEKAKAACDAHLKSTLPARGEQTELAAHAIRLAKLDVVIRAVELDPTFEVAAPEDVEDLLDLLAVVPFDALLDDKLLVLNPNFGEASKLVGGADTDLITGDMLVDFKTTKSSELQTRDLDQLFGYYLLARHQQQIAPTFPEIKRVALYFCRHGYLWPMDVTKWTDHPQFAEVEEWFFERAKEVFGTRVNA
jgi:hypothetical protein